PPLYSPNPTFTLPRGSGGRTPTITQLDLRLAYGKSFVRNLRAEVLLDIFNVLNQQLVTAVDQGYTFDRVLPITEGGYDRLKTLTTTTGGVPHLNPNYGQPTAYQSPLSIRVGARITF